MEDKGVDFSKPPREPERATVNRSVPRCYVLRETGFRHKTNTVPVELQWAAEDKMVLRNHEEFRCQLPDVSRSTFLMVFSPDGKKVASTHGNHNVYVTDLTSGKNIKTLTGHPRTPWCIAFHPSSNQILASGCLGGQVRVWDLSGGSEIWMAESQTVIASLAFHPIDRMLVIASYNELHFWDWSQPEPFAKCFTSNEKEKVRYVAFDALGHKLITGVANAPVRLASQWDRVAAPQPPPHASQLDSERRITICYRYMVEQYEQLVQRYCDLSRARNTLTMDRGTDPMEFESESSDSQTTAQSVTRPSTSRGTDSQFPVRLSFIASRPRLSSGTDEASASHSSTNFLTPEAEQTQPLLTSSNEPSPDNEPTSSADFRRRNPRFDITLPSFSNFRSRSNSASSPNSTNLEAPSTSQNSQPNSPSTDTARTWPRAPFTSLSFDSLTNLTDSTNRSRDRADTTQNQEQSAERPEITSSTMRQIVRNLMSTWSNRSNPSDGTSTEVNSGVDSENDEADGFRGFPVPQGESPNANEEPQPTYSQSIPSLAGYMRFNSGSGSSSRSPRNPEATSRRFSEAIAVSQLRSQFHRLQSVYESRDSASHAHIFSPETQAAERRLLNRLNEILERPLPEPRTRSARLFASRRSAFQPRPQPPPAAPATNTTPSTSSGSVTAASPDIIGGVRYGIQLLSRHIDNMQRLCRARLEILQLQQIRRMWEDLQSQIYALHGAVRDGREEGQQRTEATQAEPPAEGSSNTATTAAAALTDDDSDEPSSTGELHWRLRRTPQVARRSGVKSYMPRNSTRNPTVKRSRLIFKPSDYSRRLTAMQMEANRRQLNRQASSSTQATSEERGEASSSHVSGETSTSDERGSVRGVKRKSRDSDPLFRPRPSTSTGAPTLGSTSNLAAVMRETIVQLENMVWRHRQTSSQRNTRLSRFTRQREERRMRNLWDTESSHESSRDDQSEGDSSQQSAPEGLDTGDSELSRDSARIRARQVLLLMVDSLTQFFENDNLTRGTNNEALNDRIHNLYVLLQLALNLTDLLLAQLVHSRRELEGRRASMGDGASMSWLPRNTFMRRHAARHMRQNMGRTSLAWRRILRRVPPATSPSTSPPPTPPEPRRAAADNVPTSTTEPRPSRPHVGMSYSIHSLRSASLPRAVVPLVRVNDLPAPPPEEGPVPRFRLHSPPPPPIGRPPMFVPPRFLHPGRYSGGSFVFDESTSEDSSPQDRSSDIPIHFIRSGASSVILTDTSMSPHHRIQAWDFSKYKLPDLGNAEKNVVVGECKIHNDASVDMSKDGRLLVTLLPSGRLSMTTLLGIYSLQWDTLGQLLYTTSFEQSIVSVSLSPTTRHLVVGLASRRVALISAERHTNAQIFRLEGALACRKTPLGARGRLVHLRDLELSRHVGFLSLNCIRWAPNPGQGLVYGTNTGHLKILR